MKTNTLIAIAALLSATPADAADSPWEDFPDGSRGQVTEYRGVNGTPLPAYFRQPKGDGPFPAVVLLHGGGVNPKGTYQLGRMTQAPVGSFVAQGWAVYAIDYRPGANAQPIEWDDTCLAIEQLKKMPVIDPKRIAMMGGSHGGFIISHVISRCDLACAVPVAPSTIDLVEAARAREHDGFQLNAKIERMIDGMVAKYGAPLKDILADPARFHHESALTEAAKVRCPVLLICSGKDDGNPQSIVKTYAEKLRAAGKEAELYLPPDGHHGFEFGIRGRIPETEEAARRAVAFMRKHFGLPPETQAATTPTTPNRQQREARRERPARTGSPQTLSRLPWADPDRSAPAGTLYKTFFSKTVGQEVSYLISLPPSYEAQRERKYPVVYWLHGGGNNQRHFAEPDGFVERLKAANAAGLAPEMIVVGVNGVRTSRFSDSKDGSMPVESIIMQDLIPHLDATYRTIAGRQGRAVEGFSMGGFGALHLALKHPETFGAVSALAPALIKADDAQANRVQIFRDTYGGDREFFAANDPFHLLEASVAALRGRTFIRLLCGEKDAIHSRALEFRDAMTGLRVEHEFASLPGVKHNYIEIYRAYGKDPFAFYRRAFASLK